MTSRAEGSGIWCTGPGRKTNLCWFTVVFVTEGARYYEIILRSEKGFDLMGLKQYGRGLL